MSWNPSDSRIKVTKSLEQEISEATNQSEILAIMHRHEMMQGLVVPDAYDPNVRLEVEPAQSAYSKVITINGVDHTVSGNTETELLQAESALFQSLFEQSATPSDPHGRDARGRFVAEERSQEDLMADVELRLKLQRGEVNVSDAVDSYLSRREGAAENATVFENSWADATVQFRQAHPEWDRFAGEDATKVIGQLIAENDLMDASDKAEAMERCFAHAVKHDLIHQSSQAELHDALGNANSPEEIRRLLGRDSSSLWR